MNMNEPVAAAAGFFVRNRRIFIVFSLRTEIVENHVIFLLH